MGIQVSWVEFDSTATPKDIKVSWAEFDSTATPKDVKVSWVEFDSTSSPKDVKVSWVEFDSTTTTKDIKVSWVEFDSQQSGAGDLIPLGGVHYDRKRRREEEEDEEIKPRVIEWIHTVDSRDRLEGKDDKNPARNSFDDPQELIALAKKKRDFKIRLLLLS